MADKHHSGRYVKREQRALLKIQKEQLGMDSSICSSIDSIQNAIIFINNIDWVVDSTIKQNGRIETQLKSLDKNSKVRDEYELMRKSNDEFLKRVK